MIHSENGTARKRTKLMEVVDFAPQAFESSFNPGILRLNLSHMICPLVRYDFRYVHLRSELLQLIRRNKYLLTTTILIDKASHRVFGLRS